MKVHRYESREAWLNGRLGKVTGSTLKETVTLAGEGIKPGVFRAAAESLIGSAAIDDEENPMARGNRLEPEAIERFRQETGKKVDDSLLIWESDADPRMAVSPDGVIGKTAAVEVKCLSAAKHVEARYTGRIPKNTAGYEEQVLQYFIVNRKLIDLYYIFYDPRFPQPLDFFFLTFTRKELTKEIERYQRAERDAVSMVRKIVNDLSLYSPEEVQAREARKRELLADSQGKVRAGVQAITRDITRRMNAHG
jgi:hypothetical protein